MGKRGADDLLDRFRDAIASIPEVRDSPVEADDEMSTSVQFAQTIRKMGVQHSRQTLKLEELSRSLSSVEDQLVETTEKRRELEEAAQAERQRAVSAESDLRRSMELIVEQLDVWERLAESLATNDELQEWASQVDRARITAVQRLGELGLMFVGQVGDEYNEALHDPIEDPAPTLGEKPEITDVLVQGFSFRGQIIRRARVKLGKRRD